MDGLITPNTRFISRYFHESTIADDLNDWATELETKRNNRPLCDYNYEIVKMYKRPDSAIFVLLKIYDQPVYA